MSACQYVFKILKISSNAFCFFILKYKYYNHFSNKLLIFPCRPSRRIHNVPFIEEIPWGTVPVVHRGVAQAIELPETLQGAAST